MSLKGLKRPSDPQGQIVHYHLAHIVLGIDEKDVVSETGEVAEDKEKERKDLEAQEVKELEEELRRLEMDESTADGANESNVNPKQGEVDGDNVVDDDEYVAFFFDHICA